MPRHMRAMAVTDTGNKDKADKEHDDGRVCTAGAEGGTGPGGGTHAAGTASRGTSDGQS